MTACVEVLSWVGYVALTVTVAAVVLWAVTRR